MALVAYNGGINEALRGILGSEENSLVALYTHPLPASAQSEGAERQPALLCDVIQAHPQLPEKNTLHGGDHPGKREQRVL